MASPNQYISRKNKICHRYSQYILSLRLNFLKIFQDTCFIKIEYEKCILEVTDMENAILKSNGFIIGRDIFSTEVVRKLTAV